MDTKPTLKEIAALAEVSVATASRALAHPEKVKYSTRRKIEKALDECSLKKRSNSSKIIGLIVPDLTNQFFPMMLSGIEMVAKSNSYTIMIVNSDAENKKEEDLVKKFIDIDVDGIIIIPSGWKISDYIRQTIKDDVKPIVFLDRNPDMDDINLITTDNYSGMYQATKYLLTLGHRKILYLDGSEGTSTAKDRYRGFLDAIDDSVMTKRIYADFSFTRARDEMAKVLKTPNFEYTAILSANDNMALAAMEILKEKHIKVPEDVSVLGYDDIPNARVSGLTTIKQPFIEMGMNAMYILIANINNPMLAKRTTVLPSNIIFRSSCAVARKEPSIN